MSKTSVDPLFGATRRLTIGLALAVLAASSLSRASAQTEADASQPPASEAAATGAAAEAPVAADQPSATTPEAAQPTAAQPAPSDAAAPALPPRAEQPRLQFSFRYAPWEDVLKWLADEADLSLQVDHPPPGTFNYDDSRTYTLSEAIDLINGVLLTKGYTLLRRDRMLTVVNLEDEIPPLLVELVPPEKLDERGQFELVRTVFTLTKMSPEQAEAEISRLIGPQGNVVVLPAARQVMVTETAGRLRTIRSMIERVEGPSGGSGVRQFDLEHMAAEDVLEIARPLLGLEEATNVSDAVSISVDPFGGRIFATGEAAKLDILENLVDRLDVPLGENAPAVGGGIQETPQLLTYPIKAADPNAVLQVMQTLLAGQPEARLALDPQTNKLIAMARPADHATIRATLAEMEGEADQFDVIQLQRLDPQVVLLTINKLFGTTEEGVSDGPRVDGDPTTRQLWVRGTRTQVEQIRDLVSKLEAEGAMPSADRGKVRMLPLTGNSARSALQSAEMLWPSLRSNRIRVVTPSATIPAMRDSGIVPQRTLHQRPAAGTDRPAPSRSAPSAEDALRGESTQATLDATTSHQTPTLFVSQRRGAGNEDRAGNEDSDRTDDSPSPDQNGNGSPSPSDRPAQPEIIVSVTPHGVMIASEDTEALDEFEALLRTMAAGSSSGPMPTVFWLKYVKAETAAPLVSQIMSSINLASAPPMPSETLESLGGGALTSLLGSSGSSTSGYLSIIPDARLNALIVQGTATDLAMVEELLRVIDQESSPEDVETTAKPRLIPVIYSSAEEIAGVLKQVYADRVAGTSNNNSNNQDRRPSPEDIFRAMRGERGGGDSGRSSSGNQTRNAEPKMTIGVDAQSNALIVSAPDPLFREVEQLVQTLDQAGVESNETVEVVTVQGGVNPELLQKALASIVGQTSSSSSSSSANNSSSSSNNQQQGQSGSSNSDEIRRRIEFFRSMQSGDGFQGRGSFGGFGGSGGSSGFGSRFGGGDFGRGGGSSDRGRGDRGGRDND